MYLVADPDYASLKIEGVSRDSNVRLEIFVRAEQREFRPAYVGMPKNANPCCSAAPAKSIYKEVVYFLSAGVIYFSSALDSTSALSKLKRTLKKMAFMFVGTALGIPVGVLAARAGLNWTSSLCGNVN